MRPHDVTFDSKGNVYISDREFNHIQKFDSTGTFIKKWGSGEEDIVKSTLKNCRIIPHLNMTEASIAF
jgi:NHL repeat